MPYIIQNIIENTKILLEDYFIYYYMEIQMLEFME